MQTKTSFQLGVAFVVGLLMVAGFITIGLYQTTALAVCVYVLNEITKM